MYKSANSQFVIVTVVLLGAFCCRGVNSQISPCPGIFEYKYDGFKSYGIAKLPAATGPNKLEIKIALENADLSNPASITLVDNKAEVIEKLQNGGNIKYKIEFPSGLTSIPEIKSIMLNGHEYCENTQGITFSTILSVEFNLAISGGNASPPTRKPALNFQTQPVLRPNDMHTISFPSRPSNVLSRVPDDWLSSYKFQNVCGKKDAAVFHLVIGGRDVTPNEFPWLVALFDNKRVYFCGGSLVSDKHVITAAHCTAKKQYVLAELGKHELDNVNEEGVVLRISQRIDNHPEYRENTGHADIAVITLTESVNFSDKIKPICIWPFDTNHVGLVGTVAGWGIDISGEGTNTPMAADVDIVSDSECKNSEKVFASITSATTFCAGGKNKGPCSGDSGSGFIVENNNRWYLKGIISTSIRSSYAACNVKKYAVYCDVGKYLDWFKDILLK